MKLMRQVFVVLILSTVLFAQNPLYAPIPGGVGRLNCVSPLTCTTQGSVITIDATSVGGSGATGTGFMHFIAGVQDAAAKTVDLTSSDVTGILTTAKGGNGNGFFAVAGPATSAKTFTFPNASATVLTDNAAVTVAQGGTGVATLTAHGPLMGEGTSAVAAAAAGTSGAPFLSGGASADGAYAALNLAGGASVVSGVLPGASGGTQPVATSTQGFMVGPGVLNITAAVGGLVVESGGSGNQVKAVQFVSPITLTITRISIGVTTLSGSSTVNVGIYSADKSTKLIDSGAFDTSATGIKTTTISAVTLTAGTVYWFAWSASDTTVQVLAFSSSSAYNATAGNGILGAASTNIRGGLSSNSTSAGVMPSTLGTISTSNAVSSLVALFEP